MAKIAWPQQEAERLLERINEKTETVVFETGYGPSGLPHLGTFAEIARTLFVMKAFKQLKPELNLRLIVFTDDVDGLRKLPDNVPNHDLLRPHLGAPLFQIPDPFQEQESFSGYMLNRLRLFLDSFGFEYELMISSDVYKSGGFDEGLKLIMDHYDEVKKMFTSTISEEKREAWSPFFPTCENCGKVYSTRVTATDPENYKLSYVCDLDGKLFQSCGHKGERKITGGDVKVGWKVDWAMRWHVLKIDYEMHGKDLMESVVVSNKVCRIIGGKSPITYKYELFLDEKGQKISKSLGNGVSMEEWIEYAPLGALLNFLLGNPNKARKMDLPILPRLIDEYLQTIRAEDSGEVGTTAWYIEQIQEKLEVAQGRPVKSKLTSDITYSLLANVADSLGLEDGSLLYDYAVQYDPKVQEEEIFFRLLCDKVVAFVVGYTKKNAGEVKLAVNSDFLPHLQDLKGHLEKLNPEEAIDGNELQRFIFSIAKENGYNQRQWFAFLYATILNKEQGPKMGPFLAMLGYNKAMEFLNRALQKYAA